METALSKLGAFVLLFALMGAEWKKNDELLLEISPDSKTTVIQKEVEGIEFKFCLLNEKGEPATAFKEGENFSFFFSATNKSGRNLYFDPGFVYSKDVSFCNVHNSSSQDLGKPFKMISVKDVGPGAYPFQMEKSYIFQQQWADARESTWDWQYGLYESTHKEKLTFGNYYTGFKYRFKFSGDTPIQTDTLSFKIKFKIQ